MSSKEPLQWAKNNNFLPFSQKLSRKLKMFHEQIVFLFQFYIHCTNFKEIEKKNKKMVKSFKIPYILKSA